MATKRFIKSSIDWAAFAERVPANQKVKFQQFKAKVDGYTHKLMSYPEKPPTIDFSMYRSRLPSPAMVDEFEKQYKSFTVPYPPDKVSSQIDDQEKLLDNDLKECKELADLKIQYFNKRLQWWKDMMPFFEMSKEEFYDYFPDAPLHPYKDPSFWPHDEPSRPIFPYRGQI
ncbi:ATP synthase subunit d, mitochondrial [Parasteatoda tepidariorum]|uniref:ATP synthase subunit d, mitochondrial n=1 Tax=Parasteatoda tepidariorum TaxID=114398 RepID=UPI00077FD5FE|nr:ATP synthase subunit d, mitochondrial [Parasteatoda tepidariorum]